MENINESRNSVRTYIQSFTQHMLLKKLTTKTLTLEQKKNNCLRRIKKGISKVALS